MKYIVEEKFRAKTGQVKYLEDLKMLARWNRRCPTLAEKTLWQKLKKIRPQFLRQKSIGRFILDFYCSKLLLNIEVDGGYHLKRKNYDRGREEILYAMGIKTIRFYNKQILNNIAGVLVELEKIIKDRTFELGVADVSSKA